MKIPKIILNTSNTLTTFTANHDSFSFLSYCKFLIKSKLLAEKVNHFRMQMNSLNVTVTNNMLGVIEWPYIHSEWSIQKRLNAIVEHYSILSVSDTKLMKFHQGFQETLMSFGEDYDNVKIVLDRPNWFIREGEMVLNVFRQDLRVVSIAFTLAKLNGELIAYVGAVQGIHSGVSSVESLKINKQLTKIFSGLRPKSLAFEVLKAFLKSLNIIRIFGISDQYRHHRHKYFGNKHKGKNTMLLNNYDECWKEHGGVLDNDSGFYILSLNPAIRSLDEVVSKKRAQYRRRNDIIESINETLLLKIHGF